MFVNSTLEIYRSIDVVAKHTADGAEDLGSIPGPIKSAQCCQRLATAAMFLWSCVGQALSCGDGPPLVIRFSILQRT